MLIGSLYIMKTANIEAFFGYLLYLGIVFRERKKHLTLFSPALVTATY
jgi:hypothetical protein